MEFIVLLNEMILQVALALFALYDMSHKHSSRTIIYVGN